MSGRNNNIAFILVLFILLVIIACSCGVFGGRSERIEKKNDEVGGAYNGGCGCGNY